MHLVNSFWTSVTYVVSLLTLSPHVEGPDGLEQVALLPAHNTLHQDGRLVEVSTSKPDILYQDDPEGPIFKPPGGKRAGYGSNFTCNYTMPGWTFCSEEDNRGCWLRHENGTEFNISTDYELIEKTPIGTTQYYTLDITDDWYNGDGLNFTEAKLFNGQYPGPWIQACWGDTVSVTVNNKLKHNGTSIHWHGIRQLNTVHMDGVNGVSQCPIAPGESFTYTWRAMQYGSSWYHSHHAVQYADGALGPLTIHGPSSLPYDEAKTPILMTDWGHNSAFEALWTQPLIPTVLVNGVGNVTQHSNITANLTIPEKYSMHFEYADAGRRARRYLLRLINTSWESTFVFSIDNHYLQIVGTDFVPIHNYTNTSVLVGIGQRYHVVVEAKPVEHDRKINPIPTVDNYWIRIQRADCFKPQFAVPGNDTVGVLSYSIPLDPTAPPPIPKTKPWPNISFACSDETYSSLVPIVPWQVGAPANAPPDKVGEDFTVRVKQDPNIFPLAIFAIGGPGFQPLHIDYGNPTFLNLNYSGVWDPALVVVPENYTDQSWVYMVLKGLPVTGIPGQPGNTTGGTIGAHPIHLHGHDFAILQQIENATYPDRLNLKYDNPPRRDVVLLPTNGYVVIAFKTDNPGSWLLHCHIAAHASYGLAMQILERQSDAAARWPDFDHSAALEGAQQQCNTWNKWWGDCTNWWPGDGSRCRLGNNAFSPDSGI